MEKEINAAAAVGGGLVVVRFCDISYKDTCFT